MPVFFLNNYCHLCIFLSLYICGVFQQCHHQLAIMHKSSADAMQPSKSFCLYWIVCAQLATVPNLAPVAMSVEVLVTFSNPHNPFGGREFHLCQHNKSPQWQSTQMWRKQEKKKNRSVAKACSSQPGWVKSDCHSCRPICHEILSLCGNSKAPTRFRKCHQSLRWQCGRQKIEEASFLGGLFL